MSFSWKIRVVIDISEKAHASLRQGSLNGLKCFAKTDAGRLAKATEHALLVKGEEGVALVTITSVISFGDVAVVFQGVGATNSTGASLLIEFVTIHLFSLPSTRSADGSLRVDLESK